MRVAPTALPGVMLLEPQVYADTRGFFLELFNEKQFRALGLRTDFRQENRARSSRSVLRGLHYQVRHPQRKLVTVTSGVIYDVAVDIRIGSPSFGRHVAVTLSGDVPQLLWVPPGFAHGYCVISEFADVIYKCSDFYHPEDESGILWCDPTLGIQWPVTEPIISEKDKKLLPFSADRDDFPRYV